MKKLITILSIGLLLSGCSMNRYALKGDDTDKRYLIQQIKTSSREGYITNRPIIVLDGIPYRFSKELKDRSLNFSKSDILSIDILKKDKAIQVYGDQGKAGVMIVTTKSKDNEPSGNKLPKNLPTKDDKVLYLMGDKKLSKEELLAIEPESVESIEMINDKENICKYTSENYNFVVIITLKKK